MKQGVIKIPGCMESILKKNAEINGAHHWTTKHAQSIKRTNNFLPSFSITFLFYTIHTFLLPLPQTLLGLVSPPLLTTLPNLITTPLILLHQIHHGMPPRKMSLAYILLLIEQTLDAERHLAHGAHEGSVAKTRFLVRRDAEFASHSIFFSDAIVGNVDGDVCVFVAVVEAEFEEVGVVGECVAGFSMDGPLVGFCS